MYPHYNYYWQSLYPNESIPLVDDYSKVINNKYWIINLYNNNSSIESSNEYCPNIIHKKPIPGDELTSIYYCQR